MSTPGLDSKELIRQAALDATQAEPVDIRLRLSGSVHVSDLHSDDIAIRLADKAGGAEVKCRDEAGGREGIDNEEVLAEDEGRIEFSEALNDILGGIGRGRELPRVPNEVSQAVEGRRGVAGDVEDLGEGTKGPV